MTYSTRVNRRDATGKKYKFLHAIIHGIEAQIRGQKTPDIFFYLKTSLPANFEHIWSKK